VAVPVRVLHGDLDARVGRVRGVDDQRRAASRRFSRRCCAHDRAPFALTSASDVQFVKKKSSRMN
jgi:hypothetical protein